MWFVALAMLCIYLIGARLWLRYDLPFMEIFVDNRDMIKATPYIYGKTPPIALGEIKTSHSTYFHMKFRFRADNNEGYPNVFQTAPANRGRRRTPKLGQCAKL